MSDNTTTTTTTTTTTNNNSHNSNDKTENNNNNNNNNNTTNNEKMNRLSSESDVDSVSNNSHISNLDMTGNSEEEEEKQRLIERVLELQSTLEDLSKKVSDVKEENLKLRSENQILGNYIESLMNASSVFQTTWQKQLKK